MNITTASVKVMRSHDYCHFEVSLSTASTPLPGCETSMPISLLDVDNLRKEAARLADKAVEQYKLAKACAGRALTSTDETLTRLRMLAETILQTPEDQRTVEEKAILKAVQDRSYAIRRYDYQDDWNNEDEDFK